MERNEWQGYMKNLFLDMYLRLERLEQEHVHSAGCIVPKRGRCYWQFYEEGRQIQRPIAKGRIPEVQRKIQVIRHQEKTARELRSFLKELKRGLCIMGIEWQKLVEEYESSRKQKSENMAHRQEAKKIAEAKWHAENYKHLTDRGDWVASKSEEIIANLLFAYGVVYEYEKPMEIEDRKVVPDFTIYSGSESVIVWEHAGLMENPEYSERLKDKLELHEKAGFWQQKNLIVTRDENGAFSAETVRRMIRLYDLV